MTSTNFHENGNGSLSGYRLAHRKLSFRKRLALAADVATGVYRYAPTQAQIASSFQLHPSQLSRELGERKRRQLAATQAAAQHDHDNCVVDDIVRGWNSASESARKEAVRKIGLVRVFDVMDRIIG